MDEKDEKQVEGKDDAVNLDSVALDAPALTALQAEVDKRTKKQADLIAQVNVYLFLCLTRCLLFGANGLAVLNIDFCAGGAGVHDGHGRGAGERGGQIRRFEGRARNAEIDAGVLPGHRTALSHARRGVQTIARENGECFAVVRVGYACSRVLIVSCVCRAKLVSVSTMSTLSR